MITKSQYIEYLLNTPINYTCSNLAEHLENVSHDSVTDFLQNSKFTPKELWELVKHRIDDSEEAFLLVDDSVQKAQEMKTTVYQVRNILFTEFLKLQLQNSTIRAL